MRLQAGSLVKMSRISSGLRAREEVCEQGIVTRLARRERAKLVHPTQSVGRRLPARVAPAAAWPGNIGLYCFGSGEAVCSSRLPELGERALEKLRA